MYLILNMGEILLPYGDLALQLVGSEVPRVLLQDRKFDNSIFNMSTLKLQECDYAESPAY